MTHIAMLSGGQDSTAMTLRLLELGEPVDYIVFCDTTLEHNEMYEYIDKLDAFFWRKYGIRITRLEPKQDFEAYMYSKRTKGEHIGEVRGTPSIIDFCYWRKEAKQYPFERWIKSEGIKEYRQYTGFVYGESERYGNAPETTIAPLYEWKWTEKEVQAYLKENQMENSLYQHFTRTGCSICPKQSEADKYAIYKHYPEVWKRMVGIEKRLNMISAQHNRFHTTMSMLELEEKFKKKDRQQTFDLDFEPLSDCFCKI